jgi:hypothetical protein
MLIFILYLLVEDVMQSRGVDRVEQLPESALLWREAEGCSLERLVVRGGRHDPDGDEAEEEEDGDDVLGQLGHCFGPPAGVLFPGVLLVGGG